MQDTSSSFFQLFSQQLRENPRFALLTCAFLYVLNTMILVPLFMVLLGAIFGMGMEELNVILGGVFDAHPQGFLIYRLAQAGHQLLTWGALVGSMMWLLGSSALYDDVQPQALGRQILLATLLILVSIPLTQVLYLRPEWIDLPGFLSEWEQYMEETELQVAETLSVIFRPPSLLGLGANVLVFAIVPAVCEELFFRGVLLNQLRKILPTQQAILVSAALFSFVHFQFYGFFVRLLLGILLAVFVVRSGSLWTSIIAHCAFNATTVLFYWLSANSTFVSPEAIGSGGVVSWPIFFLSMVLTAGIVWLYSRLPVSKPTTS